MIKQQMKLATGFVLTAFAGGLIGLLLQAENFAGYWFGSFFLEEFHVLGLGFFFWIFVCSALAYHARCGMHAALLTLALLFPVICSYSISGWMFGGYVNEYVLTAGTVLLIPSAAAAWILRANRHRRWMRVMVRLIGTGALMFDMMTHWDFTPRTMMLALPMLVLFWYMMHCVSAKELRHIPQNPFFGEWDECPMF